MYLTAEIRWFTQGTIPPEVLAWSFDATSLNEPAEYRIDSYLYLPGIDSLGIKVRQGRLEVKQRMGASQEVQFHELVAGRLERWRKWSFPLLNVDSTLEESLYPAGGFIPVSKTRRLFRFAVENKLESRPMTSGEKSVSGCEGELTSLEAFGEQWWTIALESFGEEVVLAHNLARVAESIFKRGEPPRLTIADSFSYPRWLSILSTDIVTRSK